MTIVDELLRRKGNAVFSVAPDASVFDAIRSMADNHVGALLVVDGSTLVGIVSERDYARKVILMGRSSSTTAVREIMSSPVVTIGPDRSVEDAMRAMTANRIRHLPVVRGERLEGIVSIGDLVKAVIEEQQVEISTLQAYITGST
jgi:CBS domain-containing protein